MKRATPPDELSQVNVKLEENSQAIAGVEKEISEVARKLAALDDENAFAELWNSLSDRARKRGEDAYYDALFNDKSRLEKKEDKLRTEKELLLKKDEDLRASQRRIEEERTRDKGPTLEELEKRAEKSLPSFAFKFRERKFFLRASLNGGESIEKIIEKVMIGLKPEHKPCFPAFYGATGSGKTRAAIEIAQRLKARIELSEGRKVIVAHVEMGSDGASLEEIVAEALKIQAEDVASLHSQLGITHLILNIDECQHQSRKNLESLIFAFKHTIRKSLSIIPVLSGFSTLGIESTFNGLTSAGVERYLVQQSFSKENEESIKEEMMKTISEKTGLEFQNVERAFNSIYMSAVMADIGGWPRGYTFLLENILNSSEVISSIESDEHRSGYECAQRLVRNTLSGVASNWSNEFTKLDELLQKKLVALAMSGHRIRAGDKVAQGLEGMDSDMTFQDLADKGVLTLPSAGSREGENCQVVVPYFVLQSMCSSLDQPIDLMAWKYSGDLFERVAILSLVYSINAQYYCGHKEMALGKVRLGAKLSDEVVKIKIQVDSPAEFGERRLEKSLDQAIPSELGRIFQTAQGQKGIDYVGFFKSGPNETMFLAGQCKGKHVEGYREFEASTTRISPQAACTLIENVAATAKEALAGNNLNHKVVVDLSALTVLKPPEQFPEPAILTTMGNFSEVVGPVFGRRIHLYKQLQSKEAIQQHQIRKICTGLRRILRR